MWSAKKQGRVWNQTRECRRIPDRDTTDHEPAMPPRTRRFRDAATARMRRQCCDGLELDMMKPGASAELPESRSASGGFPWGWCAGGAIRFRPLGPIEIRYRSSRGFRQARARGKPQAVKRCTSTDERGDVTEARSPVSTRMPDAMRPRRIAWSEAGSKPNSAPALGISGGLKADAFVALDLDHAGVVDGDLHRTKFEAGDRGGDGLRELLGERVAGTKRGQLGSQRRRLRVGSCRGGRGGAHR